MSKTAAVVGSGFGGLAAAIRLQAAGIETSVFEALEQPGGRASVFSLEGFTFDAGPTVITDPQCLYELFALSGKRPEDYIQLLPVTPFYRLFWPGGESFDYCQDLESTFKEIAKFNADDVEGYKKFLQYSKEVYREGYERLASHPFLNFSSMLKVLPELIRLRADRSVYKTVSRFISNEKLREAFSFHSLLVGGNPFKTSSIYTLIHYLERAGGVHFPVGGTGALVKALVRLFEDIGGKLHLNMAVQSISRKADRATGLKVRGQELPFDFIISNADVVHTYSHLLQDRDSRNTGASLKKKSHSMSLFLIYFGTDKKYPQLAHHNILFGPRYKGLLDDIFGGKNLPEDFSLYLHAPTRTDQSLAPESCEGFYVLSPVGHKGHLDIDWKKVGPMYADKILKSIEERLLPGLRDHIIVKKIFTPDDFETRLNAHLGSAFSLEPILSQSAYFRVHNRDKHIKNLYFAGAGTHPGAGLPGVISSAKATAQLITREVGLA